MSTALVSFWSRCARLHDALAARIDVAQPLFALLLRLHVGHVFLLSGLTKLRDWNVTLALFSNDYHVPLLSPPVAALLGTAAELTLPLLLIAGVASRIAALALLAFNVVAATSYPELSAAGVKDHVLWGALLLVLAVYGPGRLSFDAWLSRRGSRRA